MKITIIDTFGFFFRSFYAMPNLRNKDGFPTGLLTGFINFIQSLEDEHDGGYIFFALDSKGKTFREDIDPNYKKNRQSPPEDLLAQLPVAIEWINKMGFKTLGVDGYEADDIIASVVKFACKYDMKVRVVTHDKDLYQLINDGKVTIYEPSKKIEIDEALCYEKFGVKPSQILDFLSLIGDTSDNIPGVKGIGKVGAKKLLDEFGTLENIYENLDFIANPRNQNMLREGKQSAFLSKKLATLVDDLDVGQRFDSFAFPTHPIANIKDELIKYDFRRILSTLKNPLHVEEVSEQKEEFDSILLDTKEKLFEVLDGLNSESIVAFDTETTGLDTKEARIVGFSFASDTSKAYYVPITHNYLGVGSQVSFEDAKKALQKISTCRVVGHNLKYDYKVLKQNFSLEFPTPYADTMILAWLLNSAWLVGLDALAQKIFNHPMIKFGDVVKKGEDFSSVEIEKACEYASEDAWMSLRLYNYFITKLDPKLIDEAKEVEFPFILTLARMEDEGIKVDASFLKKLLGVCNSRIDEKTKQIFLHANKEFNINSSKQLGVVLFDELGLPAKKKTKTGYSTDESVLDELKNSHEIISHLLEYREVYKLKSTYLEPLIKLSQKDSRIYTSFLQTGTTTGRLSSKDPNLQNIPVRSELGRAVREGFVARDGFKLVGLDYSQIELRLLAHFSEDELMIEAFKSGLDIHTQTALKLFDDISKRSIAKSINFGLIYGMGARKLSQTLGISSKEASEYIASYFELFPTVKCCLKKIQEDSKAEGFVQTLLGRRRYFDYGSATPMVLAGFERESVNTIFQGSAADIIKLAMNKIQPHLNENAKMLLQIHDELIFEVKEESIEEFSSLAKKIMQEVVNLRVPLEVSLSVGKNWGELK